MDVRTPGRVRARTPWDAPCPQERPWSRVELPFEQRRAGGSALNHGWYGHPIQEVGGDLWQDEVRMSDMDQSSDVEGIATVQRGWPGTGSLSATLPIFSMGSARSIASAFVDPRTLPDLPSLTRVRPDRCTPPPWAASAPPTSSAPRAGRRPEAPSEQTPYPRNQRDSTLTYRHSPIIATPAKVTTCPRERGKSTWRLIQNSGEVPK